jgi:hypothetical protein
MDVYENAIAYEASVGKWIGETMPSWVAAMERAKQLKSEGWDLFRGQTCDWSLNPSARREKGASARLKKFIELVFSHEELAFLRGDLRKALFVAQHYVESTEYIDFTTNLDVAGFFCQARDEAAVKKIRSRWDWSCLILAKRKRLEESLDWYEAIFDLQADGLKSGGQIVLPGVLTARVQGIKRLSAQKSVFITTRFNDYDIDMALDFHRLYFPPTCGLGKVSSSDLFPAARTKAEILLESHFPAPR